jgi:transposase-like protein
LNITNEVRWRALALQESYLQGISTRKMQHITEKLCGVEFSKDQVSRMVQALDEELDPWRWRPIEQPYPPHNFGR